LLKKFCEFWPWCQRQFLGIVFVNRKSKDLTLNLKFIQTCLLIYCWSIMTKFEFKYFIFCRKSPIILISGSQPCYRETFVCHNFLLVCNQIISKFNFKLLGFLNIKPCKLVIVFMHSYVLNILDVSPILSLKIWPKKVENHWSRYFWLVISRAGKFKSNLRRNSIDVIKFLEVKLENLWICKTFIFDNPKKKTF
jgi:hypothetical protein